MGAGYFLFFCSPVWRVGLSRQDTLQFVHNTEDTVLTKLYTGCLYSPLSHPDKGMW